jgi:hypothetical protein
MDKKISMALFGLLLVAIFNDGVNGVKCAIVFLAFVYYAVEATKIGVREE